MRWNLALGVDDRILEPEVLSVDPCSLFLPHAQVQALNLVIAAVAAIELVARLDGHQVIQQAFVFILDAAESNPLSFL